MATPVGFEGANTVFLGPDGTDIRDLETFSDGKQVISAWKLSPEEMKIISETGIIWLSIYSPRIPPVLVSAVPLVTIDGNRPARTEPIMPDARKKK